MDNLFDTMWSGFTDEIEKVALIKGAPKASLLRRLGASPQAVSRAGGKPGLLRRAWHSRPVKWARTYRPTRFGETVGQTAGMVGLSKAMSPGQEQQGY